jgi:hypothetical protein
VHERRNGQFVLLVTGHPTYGLPWGQDRLVPLFLATLAARQRSRRITFASAAEMLNTFGMQQGGSQYRRLLAPSSESLGPLSSSEPTPTARYRRLCTRRGSTS